MVTIMRPISLAVILSILASGSAVAAEPRRRTEPQAQQNDLSAVAPQGAKVEATAWRQVAEAIPLGSKVKIQTLENRRISGVLMRVDGTSMMVKRNARRPEPALTIAFDDVARIERDNGDGGVNVGKAIAIGLAAGGGVILSLFLIALQID